MNKTELTELVTKRLAKLAREKGEELPVLSPDMPLLGGGLPIDSLDLAVVVVELESATGRDPFAQGFVEFRTVRDLVALFCAETV